MPTGAVAMATGEASVFEVDTDGAEATVSGVMAMGSIDTGMVGVVRSTDTAIAAGDPTTRPGVRRAPGRVSSLQLD